MDVRCWGLLVWAESRVTLPSSCASNTHFWTLCQLPMGAPVSALFAELGDEPWAHRWWSWVIGFAGQPGAKPNGFLHKEIFLDDISNAWLFPAGGIWAAQIARQCWGLLGLQLPAPFAADGSVVILPISYRRKVREISKEYWAGTHVSPRTVPRKGAKLHISLLVCQGRTCP